MGLRAEGTFQPPLASAVRWAYKSFSELSDISGDYGGALISGCG